MGEVDTLSFVSTGLSFEDLQTFLVSKILQYGWLVENDVVVIGTFTGKYLGIC